MRTSPERFFTQTISHRDDGRYRLTTPYVTAARPTRQRRICSQRRRYIGQSQMQRGRQGSCVLRAASCVVDCTQDSGHRTQDYFFRFTSCLTSSFPIGLAAEMITAAVPSLNAGMVQRTTAVPSEAVLPRKITRGGSMVEITFTSIDAAAMALCERLFFVATRTSTGEPE